MLNHLETVLDGAKTVAIAGHVHPDGDCVGSCMGTWLYLTQNYPHLAVDVYLEEVQDIFRFIRGIDQARTRWTPDQTYDLLLLLDTSSPERIGVAGEALETAKMTVCIDHHVTNPGFARINHIVADASSASEVVYELMDPARITKDVAEALYTGIVHDTGVFRYSSTSGKTMRIAGALMEYGIDFATIVRDSFFVKTYVQNQIMGRTIMESIMLMDGKCIVGYVKRRDMTFYGITPKDLDGIVNQLLNTKGVEVAIFLYETGIQEFKASLRSVSYVDVARIAAHFNGGGHIRAAGCTMQGSVYDVINNLTLYIERALQERET